MARCITARPKSISALIRATVLSPFLAARSRSPSWKTSEGELIPKRNSYRRGTCAPLPVDGGGSGVGHHRHLDRRGVRADHQIDLVLRDELFIETDGRGRVRPVVVDNQLELPPHHAVLVVHVLDAE